MICKHCGYQIYKDGEQWRHLGAGINCPVFSAEPAEPVAAAPQKLSNLSPEEMTAHSGTINGMPTAPADSTPQTRNSEVLKSFVEYCTTNPELRFWQALRNWSGYHFIIVAEADRFLSPKNQKDTFNWEGKHHDGK
jgi:hypothetical protein